MADVIEAHSEGTVQRVRPQLMTVATMLLGLTPLLERPAAGGLMSRAFLTLELIPAIYTYWRFAQLRRAKRLNVPLAEVVGMR